jgi:catechol 2,3-dioxygenase-like lactoylglutathione lyase family enzyme
MSTADVERSVRFYREVRGFKVLRPRISRKDAIAGPGFTAKARLLDTLRSRRSARFRSTNLT